MHVLSLHFTVRPINTHTVLLLFVSHQLYSQAEAHALRRLRQSFAPLKGSASEGGTSSLRHPLTQEAAAEIEDNQQKVSNR